MSHNTDLHQGFGQHQQTLSVQEVSDFLKGFYLEEMFYNLGMGFTKTGVLLCYKRIFPTRYMTWMFYILLTVTLLWWIGKWYLRQHRQLLD